MLTVYILMLYTHTRRFQHNDDNLAENNSSGRRLAHCHLLQVSIAYLYITSYFTTTRIQGKAGVHSDRRQHENHAFLQRKIFATEYRCHVYPRFVILVTHACV